MDRLPSMMVANPARGQVNRGFFFSSLSSFAPENLVSRDGGSAVPSGVSPLIILHTPLRLNLDSSCFPRR